MFNYLEQLRKKPIGYRRRVAGISTTVLTALIVVIWLSTFSIGMTPTEDVDGQTLKDDLKPFQEVKASIGNFYNAVVETSKNLFTPSTATTTTTSSQ